MIGALVVLCLISPLSAKPELGPVSPQAIAIETRAISFDRTQPEEKKFGKLIFLGGIEIKSRSRNFGGYSGLVIDRTGRKLLAVSDAGLWLTGELAYEGERVTGLRETRTGSLLGQDGTAFVPIRQSDAEGMTFADADGGESLVYVSFERNHRIGLFPVQTDGLGPAQRFIELPTALRKMKPNSGLESIAVLRGGPLKGALLAFSESLLDKNGHIVGWLIGGPKPGQVALERWDNFDITDMAPLPDGSVLILERYYNPFAGVKMRIRRLAVSDIKPATRLEGEVLLEAGMRYEIDNFEAIAVHRSPSGRTVVTLLSDDNFNIFQRTLLLQFALP